MHDLTPVVPPRVPAARRRRLWELGPHAHCPVVGVCLPLAAARALMGRTLGGQIVASDHELHGGLVQESRQRSKVALAVQRALEQRHAGAVREAAACRSAEALAAWWRERSRGAGLPGALWATLTHPLCTPLLEYDVLGEVHMRQHQLGEADVALQARATALEAALARSEAAARDAAARAARQAAERERAQAEAVRLRGQLMARDARIAQLEAELADQREAAPDLPARRELAAQLQQQQDRLRELQRALNTAHDDLQRAAARTSPPAAPAAPAPARAAGAAPPDAAPLQLDRRQVLCVGGRTAVVPLYRRLVEDLGGRFEHHDGGQEDGSQRLQASLAAADLVVCQAGCVSHDAYWRVKDHCKRTGKPCVFVEQPSASSLRRALEQTLRAVAGD